MNQPVSLPASPQKEAQRPGANRAHLVRDFSAGARRAIMTLAERHGTSLFVVVATAVAALFARYKQIDEIVVGCSVGSAPSTSTGALPHQESIAAVYADLSDSPSFDVLLDRIGVQHRDIGPGDDRSVSDGSADTSLPSAGTSAMPVVVVSWRGRFGAPTSADLTAIHSSHYSVSEGEAIFVVAEGVDDLTVAVTYDSDRLGAVAPRVLEHLAMLLQGAAATPHLSVTDLPILEEGERQMLLVEWNSSPVVDSPYASLSRRFEAQAAATPDCVAVVCGQHSLTYRDLNIRANRLAHYLRGVGVTLETCVGICMARSTSMAEAILAILKAGGTYVPLDPSYPTERLAFMLRKSGVSVLITGDQSCQIDDGPSRVLRVNIDDPSVADQPGGDLPDTASPETAAYVMYTSGSTGEPRGVVVTHGNLCYYVDAIAIPLELTADDVYVHTASFSFSSSARQLFAPLAHGATVVIATEKDIRDPEALFAFIKQHGVTVIDLVPSYWRTATQALSRLEPGVRTTLLDNKLRILLSASEPLPPDLPGMWTQELLPQARFINMFGQTETTGIVACHPVKESSLRAGAGTQMVPAGRPIPGARAWILGRQGELLPIGLAGEIVIGGPGVARGYLDSPALTAEKFVPDAFSSEPNARAYRTGDLGRFRLNGTLEVLGRMDNQVKVRGVRVEIGEIEITLAQCPAVRDVAIAVRSTRRGDSVLVAYVVPAQEQSVRAIRDFAAKRLPSQMMPSAFLLVPSLPRTPNGKLDRAALPAEHQPRSARSTFVAPKSAVEEQLIRMWEELLDVRPVGIRDDFFELGGHSLLAVHLLAHLERATGSKWTLDDLAGGATVERIAGLIESSDAHRRTWLSQLRQRLRLMTAWSTSS